MNQKNHNACVLLRSHNYLLLLAEPLVVSLLWSWLNLVPRREVLRTRLAEICWSAKFGSSCLVVLSFRLFVFVVYNTKKGKSRRIFSSHPCKPKMCFVMHSNGLIFAAFI